MGKVTVHCSGNLKKLIIFPGWVRLTESKYVRFDHIDPGKPKFHLDGKYNGEICKTKYFGPPCIWK